MNENKQLTYNDNKKNTISKKELFKIISLSIITILIVGSIAYFFLVYLSDSNSLKRYLKSQGYSCSKKICKKEINDEKFEFNYKKAKLMITNDLYVLNINTKTPELEIKKDEYICTYRKDNYELGQSIDESFTYKPKCEKYILDINKYLKEYQTAIEKSKYNVNK